MSTLRVDISMDQIKKAVRQLPKQQKIELWRLLDEEIDRPALTRRFSSAVDDIRKTYSQISEDEVMADALKATHQVRKAHHDQSRS